MPAVAKKPRAKKKAGKKGTKKPPSAPVITFNHVLALCILDDLRGKSYGPAIRSEIQSRGRGKLNKSVFSKMMHRLRELTLVNVKTALVATTDIGERNHRQWTLTPKGRRWAEQARKAVGKR